MKTIELKCEHCGNLFSRVLKEHTRNLKKGRKVYCGNSCASFHKPALKLNWNNPEIVQKNLKPFWGKQNRDSYSPFRYYIAKAKHRTQYGDTDLNLEYLKNLWEIQNGICPYTDLKMELLPTLKDHYVKTLNPLKASLDRIDSTKGYVQGNVEFVCIAVNYAKNSFSRELMLDFFSNIRDTKI